jgi:hypothetical protein
VKLQDRLDHWRRTMIHDHAVDGLAPPTEDQVLGMFLYSAISDCFEVDGILEAWDSPNDAAFDYALDQWIDHYGESDPVAKATTAA